MISSKNDGRLLFQRAAEGKRGEEALQAIGDAYIDEMLSDPIRLLGQMHVYVASSDPEIREVVRIGYGDLVAYAERVSGLSPERISSFLATGMLLRVLLGTGAGRRGALGGDASRRLQEDLSRPQRLTRSSWERFAAGACLRTPRRWPVRRWRVGERV